MDALLPPYDAKKRLLQRFTSPLEELEHSHIQTTKEARWGMSVLGSLPCWPVLSARILADHHPSVDACNKFRLAQRQMGAISTLSPSLTDDSGPRGESARAPCHACCSAADRPERGRGPVPPAGRLGLTGARSMRGEPRGASARRRAP